MPVAVTVGLCLHQLREQAGVKSPLETERTVLAGACDIDPLEDELVTERWLAMIEVVDLKGDRVIGGAVRGLAARRA